IFLHGVALLSGIGTPSLTAQGGQRRPLQSFNRDRDIPLIHVSSPGIAMAYACECRWPWTTTRADRNAMNRIVYIVGFVVIVLVILGFFGLR
ncbi:hypothetical protein VQ045_21565, partial [Aurantimonas sp. E1-2-R+4]